MKTIDSRRNAILATLISVSAAGSVSAAEFNYVNGRCVNGAGTEGWNPGAIGDCGDLRGMDLSSRSFANTSLRGALFGNARLQKAKFDGANLERADLSGTNLTDAAFNRATLDEATFSGAILERVSFKESTLRGARLSSSGGTGVVFSGGSLEGAVWSESTLSGATFANLKALGAAFTGVRFVGGKMDGGDFSAAQFDRSEFSDFAFNATILTGARFSAGALMRTRFSKANLVKAKLYHVDWKNVVIVDSVAREMEWAFSRATALELTNTGFQKSKWLANEIPQGALKNVDFSEAYLQESVWSGSTFELARFDSAIWDGGRLDGVRCVQCSADAALFRAVTLEKANWKEANLVFSIFEDASVAEFLCEGCDFRSAAISGEGWKNVRMMRARFNDATQHALAKEDLVKNAIVVVKRGSELGIVQDQNYTKLGTENDAAGTRLLNAVDAFRPLKLRRMNESSLAQFAKDAGILMIPSTGQVGANFAADDFFITSMKKYLNDGGTLFFFYNEGNALNLLFDTRFNASTDVGNRALDAATAKALGLKDLPATLPPLTQDNDGVACGDLPGCQILYGGATFGSVVMLPLGRGKVYYFGWQFDGYLPNDTASKAWGGVLQKLIERTQTAAMAPRPTLGPVGRTD